MIKTKLRVDKIDVLKGIAILLVVLNHAIQAKNPDFDNHIIFRLISSFHMPLFMFLSGFVAWGKDINLKKKALTLVLPFVAWYIVNYFWYTQINHADISLRTYFIQVFKSPDYGLWFLWVLFLNFGGLYLVRKIAFFIKDHGQVATFYAAWLLLQLSPINEFGIGLMKWHFLFFGLGYFFAGYRNLIPKLKYYKWIIIFLFPVFVFFWNRVQPPTFAPDLLRALGRFSMLNDTLINLYKIATPILGIAFIWNLVPEAGGWIYGILKRLGTKTFDIYVIHQNLLYGPTVPIAFFVALTLSLTITYVLRKIPVLRLFLFGQR